MSSHEKVRRSDSVKMGSSRAFGLVFAAVFLIIGFWPMLNAMPATLWALGISAIFLIISLIRPRLLNPFNRAWFWLGVFLHRIVNPIIMAFLYYLTVTPTALLMRFFGKRPLDLEFNDTVDTYWIQRRPRGPSPKSMKNQF